MKRSSFRMEQKGNKRRTIVFTRNKRTIFKDNNLNLADISFKHADHQVDHQYFLEKKIEIACQK